MAVSKTTSLGRIPYDGFSKVTCTCGRRVFDHVGQGIGWSVVHVLGSLKIELNIGHPFGDGFFVRTVMMITECNSVKMMTEVLLCRISLGLMHL